MGKILLKGYADTKYFPSRATEQNLTLLKTVVCRTIKQIKLDYTKNGDDHNNIWSSPFPN